MEDRYLCRAKRIDNEQWVEGFYFCMTHPDGRHTHHFIIPLGADLSLGTPIEKIQVEVVPSTICQCTGLKDKNGKLIWENDIVKTQYGKAVVVWDKSEWRIKWIDDLIWRRDLHYWANDNSWRIEVIGNIFDNKELLESEEN